LLEFRLEPCDISAKCLKFLGAQDQQQIIPTSRHDNRDLISARLENIDRSVISMKRQKFDIQRIATVSPI
jgi:hypothetical protein